MFEGRPDRSNEVVLVGRSNVGKSTLMRVITGHSFETGQRPGVTLQPNYYDWASQDFVITDLPGFGFMSGVDEKRREEIKTNIVRYLEEYADNILAGIIVLDGKAAVDIIDRHSNDDVPYVIELYYLFEELDIKPIIAVNKMDKVNNRDDRLNEIADRFGLIPPWKQWQDIIAPIVAKDGRIDALNDAIKDHFDDCKKDELKQFF
ncbi:MAG: GTP-binding protein EngB [Halobacteriaceae archaeon]